MKTLPRALSGIAPLLLAAACGGGTVAPPPPTDVVSVSVFPQGRSLAAGTTFQFVATPRDAQGNALQFRAQVWSSSAEAVASVSTHGLVTAVSPGSAKIRATIEGVTGEATVTVTPVIPPAPVATVSLSSAGETLVPNQTVALTATPKDAQGNPLPGRVVAWSTSAGEIATVSAGGLVTAVAIGTATITATSEGKSGQTAIIVQTGGSAAELVVGDGHTCARTTSNAVYCWGYNFSGQLGDGTTTTRLTPTPVSGGFAFITLTAGNSETCGLGTSNAAYCWGNNAQGLLGVGATTDRVLTPAPVSGGLTFAQLTAGWGHTCGRMASNDVYCWGLNNIHQVVNNGSTATITTPALAGHDMVEVKALGQHTCGRIASGAVLCWGSGADGYSQAGDLTFVELALGEGHTCARTISNAVYCWGSNNFGQLGNGTLDPGQWTPTLVSGGFAFVQLTAGGQHTCGRTASGAVYCWGLNRVGQLGDGTSGYPASRSTPTLVSGGLVFVEVAAGAGFSPPDDSHTCGRTISNAIYCWGSNNFGQLGDGTTQDRAEPVRVLWP